MAWKRGTLRSASARGVRPSLRRGLLHLDAVLVGAGEEEHVVAVEPHEARDGVGRDRLVGVADMRRAVRIGDRGGDVIRLALGLRRALRLDRSVRFCARRLFPQRFFRLAFLFLDDRLPGIGLAAHRPLGHDFLARGLRRRTVLRAVRLGPAFLVPLFAFDPILLPLFSADFFFRGGCRAVLPLAFFRLGFCLRLEIMG